MCTFYQSVDMDVENVYDLELNVYIYTILSQYGIGNVIVVHVT